MANAPTVSVVMPVWNGERHLAATIDAVLAQTFADFEFVIVDDGSTDSSREIVARYAAKDPRIVVVLQANGGISRALNAGLDRARGRYVAPMDHDDVSLQRHLELEVAALDADPGLVCVGGWHDLIDGESRYLTTMRPPSTDAAIQKDLLAGHGAICHPGCMMRRDAVERAGRYDPAFDLAQDFELFLRLGEVGRLANLEVPVVRYRVHEGAQSERYCAEQRRRARVACERAWARRGVAGVYEADQLWRPGPTRASQLGFAIRYGWWAFGSGERRTAAHYARRAIGLMPWRHDGWLLLACALLRRGGTARG